MSTQRSALSIVLVVFLAGACGVLGDDSGRIELPWDGKLEVTPSCIALPLPASSTDLGVVSVPVAVFARDRGRRPAESLAVSVTVGECPDSTEASTSPYQAVAGASAAVATAAQCGSRGQLPPERWGAISIGAMIGDSTCSTDSPQRLSCSLGANGTATFQVFRNSTAADLAETTVPLCFQSPAVYGTYSRRAEVVLSPNAPVAASRLLVNLNGQVAPAAATSCDDLDCARGTSLELTLLSAGASTVESSGDGGAAGAASSGDQPVVTQSTLHALLDVRVSGSDSASAHSARTVLGTDCNSATVNQVEIPAASLASQVFSVCTNGAGGSFDVRAVLLEDQRVIGARTISIPDAVRKVTKAATADGGTLVSVSMCGGVPASGVTVSQGTLQSIGTFLVGGAAPAPGPSSGGQPAMTPTMANAGAAGESAEAGAAGAGGSSTGGSSTGGTGGSSSGGSSTGGSSTTPAPASVRVGFSQGATVQECQEALQ